MTKGEESIKLYITDAPIDQEWSTGVFITFSGKELQSNGDSWNWWNILKVWLESRKSILFDNGIK